MGCCTTEFELTAEECFQSLSSTFPDISPSCGTSFNWFNEFKHGKRFLEDNPRSGCQSTSTTEENVEKVWSLVREDPRITHQDIAGILKISSRSINALLHNHLLQQKHCLRWIPHVQSDAPKMFVSNGAT
ncbi:hypothetical protein TNCV_3872621 [Trichonephila clavipes]|nr:hypothetical protein TNCV_3872621 [Trichonephila clavipes]